MSYLQEQMRDIDRSMRHGEKDRHGRRKLSPLGTDMSRSSSMWETDSLASGELQPCKTHQCD